MKLAETIRNNYLPILAELYDHGMKSWQFRYSRFLRLKFVRGSHPTLACWHCRIPCVSERPFVKKSWGLWDICELPPDLWNIKRNYEIWRAPIFYRSGWMKFKNVLAWHENNNHARWNRRAKGFCAVQRTYSCSVNSNRTGYKSLSSTMRGHADGNSS